MLSPDNLIEANYDGLVGPTHNYAGLSFGNVASQTNKDSIANPRKAALQGLDKMRALHEQGLTQGVIPPLLRPDLQALSQLGFYGTDAERIEGAAKAAPHLLRAVYSVASMWTANAATIVPACDAIDKRTHIVPANLVSTFHRSLEPAHTAHILRSLFPGDAFVHHMPLPSHPRFGDEGAANHTRLVGENGALHFFVYGTSANELGPTVYPARQTREASEAVARLCRVTERSSYLRQEPAVIDQGVFHNDVISVGNENTLFYHERAFADPRAVDGLGAQLGEAFVSLCVTEREASVKDCVATYLFNSQLVSLSDGSMLLVAPAECEAHPKISRLIEHICARDDNPINQVLYMDLRESMRNGGGPACLRLRVPLGPNERAQLHSGALYGPELDSQLRAWINRHYRDRLSGDDLRDPQLVDEVRKALDDLAQILLLPDLYAQA